MFWTHLIRLFLLPPGCLLLLLGLGLAARRRRSRLGLSLLGLGVLGLYVLSTPLATRVLLNSLEVAPPLSLEQARSSGAQAIVVLGGGCRAPRIDQRCTLTLSSLARLDYGLYLHRQTQLPVLACGGGTEGGADSEAAVMSRVAEDDFSVTGLWQEDQSQDTSQNAQYAASLLASKSVRRIILVTDEHHMRRARGCFLRQGLEVVCAPVETTELGSWSRGLFALLPSFRALYVSSQALEEWLGLAYYALRGRL